MKKILSIIILSLMVSPGKSQVQQITLETPGYHGLVYLIYYYGNESFENPAYRHNAEFGRRLQYAGEEK